LSLVVASIGLPRLLRGLDLPDEPSHHLEEDRARNAAAAAAIAAIEKSQADNFHETLEADTYAQAAARMIALYRYRFAEGPVQSEAGQMRKADEAERGLRLIGLAAEREVIFELARHGTISDATARKLIREVDLVESRYE